MTTRSDRINLEWGGGSFSALLDIRDGGKLYPYSDSKAAEKLHEQHGGKNYYKSLTGLSGAGWVPARPYLFVLGTYRTDVGLPNMASSFWQPDTPMPLDVFVPVDYQGQRIADEYPAILREGNHQVAIPVEHCAELVAGVNADSYERQVFRLPVIPRPGAEIENVACAVLVDPNSRLSGMARAVKALEYSRLAFEWPEEANLRSEPAIARRCCRFFDGLGLHVVGDRAYKVAGGICYNKIALSELTRESLQAIAPANVAVLTESVYLQQESGYDSYMAIGSFDIEGEGHLGIEERITRGEALRAMYSPASLVERLHAEILSQHQCTLHDRRMHDESVAAASKKFAAFEKYGSVVVRADEIPDDLACADGVEEFARRHIDGVAECTIADLHPWRCRSAVMAVVKFFAARAEKEAACKAAAEQDLAALRKEAAKDHDRLHSAALRRLCTGEWASHVVTADMGPAVGYILLEHFKYASQPVTCADIATHLEFSDYAGIKAELKTAIGTARQAERTERHRSECLPGGDGFYSNDYDGVAAAKAAQEARDAAAE